MAKKGEHKTHCKRGHLRTKETLYKDGSCKVCVKMMCHRWHEAHARTESLMCRNAKRRAEKQGVPFSITPEDIVVPKVCPVLGIKLHRAKGKGPQDYSPSLDRLKPKSGYVRGNITVI